MKHFYQHPRFKLVASKIIQNRTYTFNLNFYPETYDDVITTSSYSTNSSLYITNNNLFDAFGNPVINFDVNGPIVISYSEPIDTQHPSYIVDPTKVRLRDNFYNTYIDVSVAWSNSNQTLTITPDTLFKR